MSCFARPSLCRGAVSAQARRWMSACRVLADGSIRVENDGEHTASSGKNPTTTTTSTANLPPAPGHGEVSVKLRTAPCTPADLRTLDAAATSAAATAAAAAAATANATTGTTTTVGTDATSTAQRNPPSPSPPLPPPPPPPPPHLSFKFPFVGGSEGLWEVTAAGEGVSGLRPGDLAIPTVAGSPPGCLAAPETGTWRTTATLGEASLVRVPPGRGRGGDAAVVAHCSGSVATALCILEDFVPRDGSGEGEGGGEEGRLRAGDRVVFTGASSAVAQILLQLAASRGLESVCLVNSEEEAALAMRLGAWKATLLKEFKAMRMNNAHLVADGEGGVLGFTAARALGFRGSFVSYADASGDGVSLPVAGQIFSDTRCRGFSLARWATGRPAEETRGLTVRALEAAAAAGLKLEGAREFDLSEAVAGIGAARTSGGPVLFRA